MLTVNETDAPKAGMKPGTDRVPSELFSIVDPIVSDLHYVAKCIDCLAMGISSKEGPPFHTNFGDSVYFMGREVKRLADELFDAACAKGKEAAS
jgi:hypothetical protein